MHIFSVYDSKAEAYLPPFFLPQLGQGTRVFANAANDPNHQFGANPEDYTLFNIGTFDDDTAIIETMLTPKSLGTAQEFQKTEEQEIHRRPVTAPEISTQINEAKNQ